MMNTATQCALPQKEGCASAPRKVCFVCTGNTCRSPMAAAVANALAQKAAEALPDAVRESFVPPVTAISAGICAREGDPIARNAVKALEDAGISPVPFCDYHRHTAHTLGDKEAEEADLIVGMTPSHVLELMMRFPACASKITCMPEPVSDPYGGDAGVYRQCLSEITRGVRALLFSGKERTE